MTYAGGRPTLDADSHLMELPGFLDPFIETSMRDRLAAPGMAALAPVLDEATDRGRAPPADAAARGRGRGAPAARQGLEAPWARSTRPSAATSSTCSASTASSCSPPSPPRCSSGATTTCSTPAAPPTTGPSPPSARTTRACCRWRSCPLDDTERAVAAAGRGDRPRLHGRARAVARPPATGRRPTPTSTRSGRCSTTAACRSCCTSAAAAGCSTGPSTTTAARSPTTSAAARTSAPRTSSPSPLARRCSSAR